VMEQRSLDIGRSFSFAFEDQNWIVKLLIGGVLGLLSFLLVPIPVMAGYQLAVLRNTAEGRDVPLPEWDDFGRYLSEGLQFFGGVIVYLLPIFFMTCCLVIATGATDGSEDPSDVVALMAFCFSCLIALYSLGLAVIVPAAMIRFAETRRLASMFEFGQIFSFVQRNLGTYAVAVLLGIAAQVLAGLVASVTCGIASPWTGWWASLVQAHLLGQVWKLSGGPRGSSFYGSGGPNDDDFTLSSEMPL
jgi:hypothetical protein